MPKSIPPLPNNLRHKGYWTSANVESWSIESFDLYWIQQNPRLDKKFVRAHTSLGNELDVLLQAPNQKIVDKARKCDDGYDVSFDEFVSSSETATAPVSESSESSESSKDELTEVALGKRKLEDIEGDEADVEPEDQNDVTNENKVGDVPASSNDDPEELEDSENIEFDLESVADELRRAPKVEWNVGAVNVTQRFRRYQGEVLKKAKREGLTYKNIYEVL
ncbi:hypothetical protein BC937DRAFT_93943 [Endogone sp. FLAS-F59071]|nr:hypothetical protein BC937DRAFT_93943 [Endogone sp. FLAS-F59071]|eukprot:RUS20973.1 hypothetical protein BC937DRAFT_93943 [Endogone sp. FLAS-F59071]